MNRAEAIQNAVKKHSIKSIGIKNSDDSYTKKVAGSVVAAAVRKASASSFSNLRSKRAK